MRFNIGVNAFYPNRWRKFPLLTGDLVILHYGKREDKKPHTAEGENVTILGRYRIVPGSTLGGEIEKIAVKRDGSGELKRPKINVNISMDKDGYTLGGAKAELFTTGEPWILAETIKF